MKSDKYHTDYLSEMLYNMTKSNKLTDVTLVCDDKTQISAHQNVLSACSDVFKSMIGDLHQSHLIIYLKGIQHQEIESILEFMYLGEATFSSERMKEFFTVAKNLEIKGVDEIKKENNESPQSERFLLHEQKNHIIGISASEPNEVDELKREKIDNLSSETILAEAKPKSEAFENLASEDYLEVNMDTQKMMNSSSTDLKKFQCPHCDKGLAHKAGLKIHILNIHEGGEKTPCSICGKIVRNIETHMKQAHLSDDQKKFHCQDCGKGFIHESLLNKHKMSVHIKAKPFKCRYGCEFRYNDISNRNAHERKTHE